MKTYSFHEGEMPMDYSLEFEESLFNTQAHRRLQSPDGWHSFYILNELKKGICGSIHFHVADQKALSPYRAPFGSLEFDPEIPAAIVYEFLQFSEKHLVDRGVTSITMKNYPLVYQSDNASLLETLLKNLNYQVSINEIGSVIEVTSEDARAGFLRSHPKQFEKGQREGLAFKETDIATLNDTYHFIEQCRTAKGYVLSMNFKQLFQTVEVFPTRFKTFGVFKEDRLIAASITIRVKKNVLYEFYHDHDAEFDHISPVVTLVAGIHKYCFHQKIKLFDLGTSAIDGKPNAGLLQFKSNLGAKPTPKLTFYKNLEQ